MAVIGEVTGVSKEKPEGTPETLYWVYMMRMKQFKKRKVEACYPCCEVVPFELACGFSLALERSQSKSEALSRAVQTFSSRGIICCLLNIRGRVSPRNREPNCSDQGRASSENRQTKKEAPHEQQQQATMILLCTFGLRPYYLLIKNNLGTLPHVYEKVLQVKECWNSMCGSAATRVTEMLDEADRGNVRLHMQVPGFRKEGHGMVIAVGEDRRYEIPDDSQIPWLKGYWALVLVLRFAQTKANVNDSERRQKIRIPSQLTPRINEMRCEDGGDLDRIYMTVQQSRATEENCPDAQRVLGHQVTRWWRLSSWGFCERHDGLGTSGQALSSLQVRQVERDTKDQIASAATQCISLVEARIDEQEVQYNGGGGIVRDGLRLAGDPRREMM
nr:hypothetical protein Iba_chr12aCG14970 [Ipomoea batatas]